jgi:hypothetical protein
MKKLIFSFLLILLSQNLFCQWQWIKQIGNQNAEIINSLITDGENVFVIGVYSGILYLPNDTLHSNGGSDDFFIAKFDGGGNLLWAKTLGSANTVLNSYEDAHGVYDPINNCIYVAGAFIEDIYFGSSVNLHSSNQDGDIFIARMDLDGNFQWAKKLGSVGMDDAYIFAKPDGNILLSAHFTGNTLINTTAYNSGGVFVSYDSNGNFLWAKHSMNGPEVYSTGAVFIDNDFVLSGAIGPNLSNMIDTFHISVNGPYDGYVVRYDSVGNLKWLKILGGSGYGALGAISSDGSRNLYCAGTIRDSIAYGSSGWNTQYFDYLILKLDESGNLIWSKTGNSTDTTDGVFLLSNSSGEFYFCGSFSGSCSFGLFNLISNSDHEMFISRFDSSGNCIGIKHFGEASSSHIAIDNANSVLTAGLFENTINVGSNTLTSYGYSDIFITKLDPITGIEEPERKSNNQLIIYANPSTGKCTIKIPDELRHETNLTLLIFDNTNKLVQKSDLLINDETIKLNLDAIAKGVYNIILSNSTKSYSGRIIFE